MKRSSEARNWTDCRIKSANADRRGVPAMESVGRKELSGCGSFSLLGAWSPQQLGFRHEAL